jgi:hypothetical protein
MRTWLVLLLAIGLLFVLPKINTRRMRRAFPLMERLDRGINIVVVVCLAIYLFAFVRWLLSR